MTIPECQKKLPPAKGGKELLPESMLWLLLTGEIPSEGQVRGLSRQLAEQGDLPAHVKKLIDSLVVAPICQKFLSPGLPLDYQSLCIQ
jgi:citrate synthase